MRCLGQSINDTILWHKQDIKLSLVAYEQARVHSTPPAPGLAAAVLEE
jgi:hypothetical protein